MGDLHFLIPKLPVAFSATLGLAGSMLYGVSYSDTVGLGSILVAALVVVAGGVFTLRSNLKGFWKDLAAERGEQVKVLEGKLEATAELVAAKQQELVDAQLAHTQEMAAFAEEQREVRHQLKTQVAGLEGRLKLEEAKHDLSGVMARLDGLEQTIDGRTVMFERMADGVTAQAQLLTEIRDQLATTHHQPSTKGT